MYHLSFLRKKHKWISTYNEELTLYVDGGSLPIIQCKEMDEMALLQKTNCSTHRILWFRIPKQKANVQLVQKGKCWTWNQRSRDSILTGGNIYFKSLQVHGFQKAHYLFQNEKLVCTYALTTHTEKSLILFYFHFLWFHLPVLSL